MWKFPSSEDLSYDFLRIFLQWGPALWPKAKEHYEEHCVHGQPGDNVTGGVGESVVDNHLCRPHDNHYNQQLQILQAFCEDSFGWKSWHEIYIYWYIEINIVKYIKYCRRSARTLLTATSGSSWRRVSTSCWSSSSGKKEPPLRSSWLWQFKGFIEFYASLISILPPQNMNFQFSWNSRNLQIWKLKLENLIK